MNFGPTMALAPRSLLGVIGLATVSLSLLRFLSLIRVYIRPSRLARYAHPSPSGQEPWAMVTGASDGIGRCFVNQLAASGFNVVLHGRNREKLSRVVSELEKTFPARSFRIVVAEAGAVACSTAYLDPAPRDGGDRRPTPVDFKAIQRELDDLNLTVLVNNVGGGPKNPTCRSLSETPEDVVTSNVSLNALFPLHLTRALLPNLARHGPSVVMNISTLVDDGLPLLTSYSASKVFIMAATRAVRLEVEMEGLANDVEILGVKVGKTTGASGFTNSASVFMPSADTMAKAALSRIGYNNGIVAGYWAHALQELSMNVIALLPQRIADKTMLIAMKREKEELNGEAEGVKQS